MSRIIGGFLVASILIAGPVRANPETMPNYADAQATAIILSGAIGLLSFANLVAIKRMWNVGNVSTYTRLGFLANAPVFALSITNFMVLGLGWLFNPD